MKGLPRLRRPVLLSVLGASTLALFAVAALLFSPPPADAQTIGDAWAGLAPDDLDEGDKYRILFVTSTTRNAASTDIADYNTFVQDTADAATGNPFAGVTFKALGSTDAVDARCNTLGSVVKLSFQASNRSISVIPAKAGIQNPLLFRHDLDTETPGFLLPQE